MGVIIQLFFVFLKIGAFSFGGGYAMLPFIQKEVIEKHQFINLQDFLYIIGISQMTPGPVAINSATFVGYNVGGILGSIFATLGVVSCSFILVLIISKILDKFKESKFVKGALLGMRPVLVALVVKAFIDLATVSYKGLFDVIIGAIIAVLIFYKKVNPMICVAVAGVLGILFYGG